MYYWTPKYLKGQSRWLSGRNVECRIHGTRFVTAYGRRYDYASICPMCEPAVCTAVKRRDRGFERIAKVRRIVKTINTRRSKIAARRAMKQLSRLGQRVVRRANGYCFVAPSDGEE